MHCELCTNLYVSLGNHIVIYGFKFFKCKFFYAVFYRTDELVASSLIVTVKSIHLLLFHIYSRILETVNIFRVKILVLCPCSDVLKCEI